MPSPAAGEHAVLVEKDGAVTLKPVHNSVSDSITYVGLQPSDL